MQIAHLFLALIFAPLFPGIINRIKSFFAGRKGPPVFQLYLDLFKLFQKGAIYSQSTSFIFRIAPVISIASLFCIALFIPLGPGQSLLSFNGDLIFIAYLLAMSRCFTVLAALDTGSSLDSMGASREATYAVFVEPSLFLIFATLVKKTGFFSFSEIYHSMVQSPFWSMAPVLILICTVLLIIILTENCRIPIDDPNTHLELTMIHEVMVLDYSSKDLGIIFYASSLKIWIFSSLLVSFFIPAGGFFAECCFLGFMALMAVIIGIIESMIARIRLIEVFDLLLLGIVTATFAFLLQLG